jgi:hypothetical protein
LNLWPFVNWLMLGALAIGLVVAFKTSDDGRIWREMPNRAGTLLAWVKGGGFQ